MLATLLKSNLASNLRIASCAFARYTECTHCCQARNNDIAVEDMSGGTFSISNGGVYGSMFGTPIINPPQSAILGMHGIFDRPVAVNGKVGHVMS